MVFTEIITRKRDGKVLQKSEIEQAIHGYVSGSIPDYQMSSLLMAMFLRGMSMRELADLTRAMIDSGERYDLSDLPGIKIDKHSTGGVGDKISIPLAPLVAAAGGIVPMVAGRGLGHTGGTIDKLESIPNYRTRLTRQQFRRQLKRIGVVLCTQSERLVPADRKLYALRDVTGTVESIPLIAASILSKKIASGVEALAMDVKVGSGAFMPTAAKSEELARTLVALGAELGLKVVATLTDMSQPLGRAIGNALEIYESIEVLQGGGPADVAELTIELGARMLTLGGHARSMPQARAILRETLASGAAFERFLAMVESQGGDPGKVEKIGRLKTAPLQGYCKADRSGYLSKIDTRQVGLTAVGLGAGRFRLEDKVDHGVGLIQLKKIGARVDFNEPIFAIHARTRTEYETAAARLSESVAIGGKKPSIPQLIKKTIQTG